MMYTLPEIGLALLDRPPEDVGTPVPVEAFESIRLSIWAAAEAAPKSSTDASATVATFMLITPPWPSTNGKIPRFQKAARLSARIQLSEALVRFGLQAPDPAFPNIDVRDRFPFDIAGPCDR